ncbi:STAS domain-containing protein [Planctomonas deserti]|uniref:STAS domain-containing protein n=1 Tax=Planctomonas deserti TaxID=2144185 RepID=UPI000D398506|nr:STAS domain-containing protein [Planctomonas deserti]
MYFPTDLLTSDVAVIRGTGRLNMLTASRLDRTVRSVLRQGRSKIVLDLSAVEFLDSTGLGAMIAGLKAARAQGGDLRLVGPGPQPSMVLTMSHLDRILTPRRDVHTAYAD